MRGSAVALGGVAGRVLAETRGLIGDASGLLDAAMELTVVPSFTRVGYAIRSRIGEWPTLDSYDLTDRVVLLTGGTSGLGAAAAVQLTQAGATVVITGRDADRTEAARARLSAEAGVELPLSVAVDMGNFGGVRQLADDVLARFDRLDVLVNNAGALSAERTENANGVESTVASQVVGPFLLTSLLEDRLRSTSERTGRPSRVLTMTSGGMYTAPLAVDSLQMSASSYRGADQYARAKRAQVVLTEMQAARHGAPRSIVFHTVHPGWADTPGVAEALPLFGKLLGPALRTPDEGADCLAWLAADDGEPLHSSGLFWHDREARDTHRLARTSKTDTEARRAELWDWVAEAAEVAVAS